MKTMWYRGNEFSIPTEWDKKNWDLPYAYLANVEYRQQETPSTLTSASYLDTSLVSGFDVDRALKRTSLTASESQAIPRHALAAVTRSLYAAMQDVGHLFAGLVTTDVVGWADAYWTLDTAPRHLRKSYTAYSPEMTRRFIQGQTWADGSGIGVILGLDWEYGRESGLDADVLYAESLLNLGRIGQAMLYVGQQYGLRGRMTPAVHESTGSEMLELPEDRDCLYFLKLAHPRKEVE